MDGDFQGIVPFVINLKGLKSAYNTETLPIVIFFIVKYNVFGFELKLKKKNVVPKSLKFVTKLQPSETIALTQTGYITKIKFRARIKSSHTKYIVEFYLFFSLKCLHPIELFTKVVFKALTNQHQSQNTRNV